jgi:hypothetical protein
MSCHDKSHAETIRDYLNEIKAIYDKPLANIVVNGKKQSISSKIRNETRVSTLSFLFSIMLGFLQQ